VIGGKSTPKKEHIRGPLRNGSFHNDQPVPDDDRSSFDIV